MILEVFLTVCGIIAVLFLAILGIITYYFHQQHKSLSHQQIWDTRMNIGEVFVCIDFIIQIESKLFEQYFQNNTTADLTSLTNTEFTNIYNELSMRCLKAVSPAMWQMSELYMNREEVQTYITQQVMQWLLDRSTVSEDIEEA